MEVFISLFMKYLGYKPCFFIQICLAHPMGSGSCSKNEAGYQTSSASFNETVPETVKLQAVYFEASGTIYAELRKEELDGKYERNSGSY